MFGRATITLGIGPHSSLLCFDTIHMCDSQTHGQHAVACCSYNDGDGHLVNVQRNKACSSSMHCGTECVNNVDA